MAANATERGAESWRPPALLARARASGAEHTCDIRGGVYPMESAAETLMSLKTGHTRGKIVLVAS
jgi:hypothetical protein